MMYNKIIRELELLACDMVCGEDQERIFKRAAIFRRKKTYLRRTYWEVFICCLISRAMGEPKWIRGWEEGRLQKILKGEI